MEIAFKNVSLDVLSEGYVSKIIDDLSFEIKEKKITFIFGKRGKSTVLSLIAGDDISSFGEVICEVKSVCFLRQNPEDYFFCNTVYEEILFELKKRKIKCDYDKKIISALKMVGLDKTYLNRSPFEVSKGEQKKIALAKVLACNPKLFILDEPFTNLDYASKKKIIKLFRMMKLRYGKTFIIATNDVDAGLELSDEVICLGDGKLIFKGNKYDLFLNNKLLKQANISKPQITKFTDLVKDLKGVKLECRDDINDLMKDIYRFVR